MSGNVSSPTPLILYSYWQSSCSWRVRFALHLKGISYEYRAVNLSKGEQFNSDFEQINPLHFVPSLVDGDVVVSDSYAILLVVFGRKISPKSSVTIDPQLRAVNLQAASIVSSSTQPLLMMSVVKYIGEKISPEEAQSWAQSTIEKGFHALETLLKDFACKYATGEEVSMADVFLTPQIALGVMRFKVDMSKFPTLSRIYESCQALSAYQASSPERQPDAVL